MNIKKRIDFFAKISGRNSHSNPGQIGGASDTHAMNIPCGDADATHKQRMETPIYATERLQKNIEVSANSPAEATDVNLSARVAKAIQAKMKGQSVPGESRWFLEEIGQYIPTGCVYLIGGSDFTTFRYNNATNVTFEYYKDGQWTSLEAGSDIHPANGLLCIRAKKDNAEQTSMLAGLSGKFTDVIGDSRYLVNWENPESVVHMDPGQFYSTTANRGLFQSCTSLASISKDFLPCDLFWQTSSDDDPNPSANYAAYAYAGMFEGCSALKNAPNLPAFRVAPHCYYKMFAGCTSLEDAPALPAEATAASGMNGCYKEMFNGCTSLKACPTLPATTLYSSSYESMFQGCTRITSSPSLDHAGIKSSCYKNMFNGCTSLVTTGKVSNYDADTAGECFYGMFQGCTSLEALPEFARTKNTGKSHMYMFKGCTSLKSLGTLELSSTSSPSGQAYMGMFSGCTGLTSLSFGLLTDTTISTQYYQRMFENCTGITEIPAGFLPNVELKNQCYEGMFAGCSSLKTVPTGLLPATTLATSCYKSMFMDCISLTQAPYLPAGTPATDCYTQMFVNCQKLAEIRCNLERIDNPEQSDDSTNAANYCTHKWVANNTSGSATWGVATSGHFCVCNVNQHAYWEPDDAKAPICAGVPYLGVTGTWTFEQY